MKRAMRLSLEEMKTRARDDFAFPHLKGVERDRKRLLVINTKAEDKLFKQHHPEISKNGPYEILIKMTVGSFRNYTETCLLHCGISDSKGKVFNFDQNGYHEDARWPEAIRIKLSEGQIAADKWDESLKNFTLIHKLTGKPYRPLEYNCFHYAVGFLNFIEFRGKKNHTLHSIEKELLNAPSQRGIKYLEYWKRIEKDGSMEYPFTVEEQKTISGEEKKTSTKKRMTTIALFADGFILNGGGFRPKGQPDNDDFVESLLTGKVPKELEKEVKNMGAKSVDVDFKDFRPRLHEPASKIEDCTYKRRHKGYTEYLDFNGKTVTYREIVSWKKTEKTLFIGSFGFEERPYTRIDGKIVQRQYFIMKGAKEYAGQEKIWELETFNRFAT